MAYGNEVVLGFSADQYGFVANELGIYLPQTEDDWSDEDLNDKICEQLDLHRLKLIDIHENCLNSLDGFTKLTNTDTITKGYLKYNTPEGVREFSPFNLELFWDPNEMDEEPEHSTFGIALSGRYFPTFLDWKSAHGTLYPVRFDTNIVKLISIATEEIKKVFSCFEQANICIIERHY